MMDLETLATSPDAQVLTIGCTKFDPFSFAPTHSDFYFRMEIDDQELMGRIQDEGTLNWWAQQSQEAQDEAFGEPREDVRTVLQALKKWYVGCDNIWSQGNMDIIIMEDMCRQYNEPIPWAHWMVGDSRPFLKRMPYDPRKDNKFLEHHALEDAKAQVDALRKTFQHFGMKK